MGAGASSKGSRSGWALLQAPSSKYALVTERAIIEVTAPPEEAPFPPKGVKPWDASPVWSSSSKARPILTEEEQNQVLEVLQSSRIVRLRLQGGFRSLKQLVEGAQIEEYPPGSTLCGDTCWADGHRIVLSGRAKVVLASEGPGRGSEVAALQRGDTFGWPSFLCSEEEETSEAWNRCQPRVVVGADEALRVAQLSEDEAIEALSYHQRAHSHRMPGLRPGGGGQQEDKGRSVSKRSGRRNPTLTMQANNSVGGGGNEFAAKPKLSDRFARLWLVASAPAKGLATVPAGMPRAHFQAALWSPLLDRLEELLDEIRRRKSAGYRIHDCFPLQGYQIVELKDHVYHMTELWYGSERGGNVSTMYRWFCEAMDLLGVTAYHYEAIPRTKSPDGWATVVDGAARMAALKGKGSNDALYVSTGGVAQRQGRSAIDNTVLRNVFMPYEAQELLIGRRLRKFLCLFIKLRQRCILRRLEEKLELDLHWLAQAGGPGRGHRVVKNVLNCLTPEELETAGIHASSACFRALKLHGAVLAGYGQLEPSQQKVVWELVRKLLKRKQTPSEYTGEPRADSEDCFERYVAWCRDFPGEYFERSREKHISAMVGGLFANKIVIIRRSAMEKMTLARYFPLAWQRTQPLWGYGNSGPLLLRPDGVREASNVRANECPYASLHGMSLSAGGFASDTRMGKTKTTQRGYTLLMELQWVRDPKANIENWYITDIEKILHEAYQMNPHGPASMMLPGEIFVNVGQNPKVGSSIKQTQHTQICQGSLVSYPILQMESTLGPRPSDELGGASLEMVDVGPEGVSPDQCGLILRIVSERPTCEKVLKFLVDLRFHLLSSTEGAAEAIDFLVTAVSDEQGKFVVIFAPIPQLIKLDDRHPDLATWANPLTGESSESAGLEETRIDFGKGVGHFLVAKQALRDQLLGSGEETLRRIWAFNRVPGVRDLIDEFIVERGIFPEDLS